MDRRRSGERCLINQFPKKNFSAKPSSPTERRWYPKWEMCTLLAVARTTEDYQIGKFIYCDPTIKISYNEQVNCIFSYLLNIEDLTQLYFLFNFRSWKKIRIWRPSSHRFYAAFKSRGDVKRSYHLSNDHGFNILTRIHWCGASNTVFLPGRCETKRGGGRWANRKDRIIWSTNGLNPASYRCSY